MHFVSLNIYGRERSCRTQILACSTTYAARCIYGRNLWRCVILRIRVDHRYGSCRTMACTVATFLAIGDGHTVFLYPYGMAYLYARLVLAFYWLNCSSRAHFATTVALWSAIATLVRHGGLHKFHNVCRWAQHIIRAFGYAELAGSAMTCHVLCRQRSWRCEWSIALGSLLVFNLSQSAVHLFLLLSYYSRCCGYGSAKQKRAACRVDNLLINHLRFVYFLRFLRRTMCIAQGFLSAFVYAVAAHYAT